MTRITRITRMTRIPRITRTRTATTRTTTMVRVATCRLNNHSNTEEDNNNSTMDGVENLHRVVWMLPWPLFNSNAKKTIFGNCHGMVESTRSA